MNNKVFLGGTCAGSSWREDLTPLLGCGYFNPVVLDWTPECQAKEEEQKDYCGTHLYLINQKMEGVFSIAEAVHSAHRSDKTTVFCVNTLGFTVGQIKSLAATSDLIESLGAIVITEVTMKELASVLNTITPKDEDSTLDTTVVVNNIHNEVVGDSGFQPTLRSMSPDGTDVLEEEWIVTETINGIMKQNIYRKVYKV